jgi:hypothetical protein
MSASSNPNSKSAANGATGHQLGDAEELLRRRPPVLETEEDEEQEELDDDDFDDEFDDDFEQELADEWEELDDVNGDVGLEGEEPDEAELGEDDESGDPPGVDPDGDDF